MTKYFVVALTVLGAIYSLTDSSVIAQNFCCAQGDPSTCAVGISVDRYYCYATMTDCQNGTCDASY